MATNAEKELSENLEQVRADIAALSETVSKLVSDTAGIQSALRKRLNNAARQASAAGETFVDDMRDMGNEAIASVTRQASAAVGTAEDHIAKNPMVSVLAALGVGFVVGLISRK